MTARKNWWGAPGKASNSTCFRALSDLLTIRKRGIKMDLAVKLPNYSSTNIEPVSNPTQHYRKYPDAVKDEVAKTKNIYLFPELNIPRTTAQYWVKRQRPSRASNVIEFDSVFKKKSEFLETELAKERAMRRLLETVRKVFPYDFRTRILKNKQSRAQIISAIQECLKFHKLNHCLDVIERNQDNWWTRRSSS
jgi:hypothetical protein